MHAIKPGSMVGQELNLHRVWFKTHTPELFYPRREEAWVFMFQLLRIIGYRQILGAVNFPAHPACHKCARGTDSCTFGKGPSNRQLEVGRNPPT